MKPWIGRTALALIVVRRTAYFHKGTDKDGDTDTWFIPVDKPGMYEIEIS